LCLASFIFSYNRKSAHLARVNRLASLDDQAPVRHRYRYRNTLDWGLGDCLLPWNCRRTIEAARHQHLPRGVVWCGVVWCGVVRRRAFCPLPGYNIQAMLPRADNSTKALNCRNLAICTTATMHPPFHMAPCMWSRPPPAATLPYLSSFSLSHPSRRRFSTNHRLRLE